MSMSLTDQQLSALTSATQAAAKTAASSSTSAAAAASAASNSSSTGTASGASGALTSLSGNYNDFLKLFTTQLQDQDPDSPMDSDEFTSELVQFSSVEQQVQTNTNLNQLIQLTQGQDLSATSGLIGKQVQISGSTVPLEHSNMTLDFATASAEPVAISVTNASGIDVADETLTSKAGANTWTWNGVANDGTQLADGAYNVSVQTSDSSGTVTAVPFTSVATPTSVAKSGNSIGVTFGATTLDESDLTSLTAAN